MKPELFLLIFTAIFAAFVWCCHWYLNAIQASEDAKLKLMSLAENNGQKREVAELFSKSRVSTGDVKRLSEKFLIKRRKADFFEKNKLINDFVNEYVFEKNKLIDDFASEYRRVSTVGASSDNRNVSECWHHNPFDAIAEVATPKDLQKMAEAILGIISWPEVNGKTLLDDLLQEVFEATGIDVNYIQGGDDPRTYYHAAYNGNFDDEAKTALRKMMSNNLL